MVTGNRLKCNNGCDSHGFTCIDNNIYCNRNRSERMYEYNYGDGYSKHSTDSFCKSCITICLCWRFCFAYCFRSYNVYVVAINRTERYNRSNSDRDPNNDYDIYCDRQQRLYGNC